ncbi:uncharacterized protein METZ01_LOCUS492089, partial [marine metagenome]
VKKMDVNITTFNLQDIIKNIIDTLEPYARINNNVINVINHKKSITIRSDKMKIRQILFNLLSNACKYSEYSTIILDINQEEKDGVQFICLKVIDKGKGIPLEKINGIFEPFNQADSAENNKVKGTGLGLTITRGITQLLGGYIHVESEEGNGATFTSYILQDYSGKEKKAQKSLDKIHKQSPKNPYLSG